MWRCVAKACQRWHSHWHQIFPLLMSRHWTWSTLEEKIIMTYCGCLRTDWELHNNTSTRTWAGQKRSCHWGKCVRKLDYLVSFGNTSQHSSGLINPNSIQATSILKVVCSLPGQPTWWNMNSGFLQDGLMILLLRRPADDFIAVGSQSCMKFPLRDSRD